MQALGHAAKEFCSDESEGGQELKRLCAELLNLSKTCQPSP